MKNRLRRLVKDDSGATAIEYGLIAALVAVVVVGSLTLMRPQLQATFAAITTALTP
ncbi:Flp family type IVb pilin [Paracoccus salsus]|uniref:Flp family type IVb pilin n=1 Tax=Paracoccus salsus TaxID=2911061 RepID=UPI001F1E1798|nr:Flp family type IVb pilin [Paracoccus salsus]MCF3972583.1 Flp family type IVb pilin [Paracoccus salsus]